jgi:CBS domain-containing protein
MQWQVGDVMTREVVTVRADAPVGQVTTLLDHHGISAVPVVADDGRVLGVVSQTDLLADVAHGDRSPRRSRAGDLMTAPAVFIDAGATLAQAARTMHVHRVRRLLVADPHGRLLGIVSRSDLLRPYARDGAAVGREVEEVLRRRLWIPPGQVRVRVDEGAAVLTGEVGRRSTAGIAARLTAAVPGVTTVVDRIRYEFDDAELARSRVSRTHPFSAEPFRPGSGPRRSHLRPAAARRRARHREAS